jgi:hypothetical protein
MSPKRTKAVATKALAPITGPGTKSNHVRKLNWSREQAFETFLLMGPDRKFTMLAKETGRKAETLRKWAKEGDWAPRLQERDREATEELAKEAQALYIEKVKKKHLKYYDKLQSKAMRKINKMTERDFENGKDAAIALDIGIKGEREVLGLKVPAGVFKAGVVKEGFAAMMEMVMGTDTTQQGNGFGAPSAQD